MESTPFFIPSTSTCPRLLPSRIVAWPGCEPRTSRPESQSVNHYATEPSVVICLERVNDAISLLLFLLGDIAEKRLSVCLSVCLSRSSIVLKQQKISTRFLFRTTAPCLSQIALKIWLTSVNPWALPPQILSQSYQPPVDLSVGDMPILRQNCGRMPSLTFRLS